MILLIITFITSSSLAEEKKTLELRVFGICPTCSSDVKSKVLELPGVHEAQVDIVKKKIRASYNPESVSETKIILDLRRGGYEVRRPFEKSRVERTALGISGIKDKSDLIEIEWILYAYFDVDQVEISKISDNIVAIVNYKKGGGDPKQFVLSVSGILPELEIEVLKNLDTLKVELDKVKPILN